MDDPGHRPTKAQEDKAGEIRHERSGAVARGRSDSKKEKKGENRIPERNAKELGKRAG